MLSHAVTHSVRVALFSAAIAALPLGTTTAQAVAIPNGVGEIGTISTTDRGWLVQAWTFSDAAGLTAAQQQRESSGCTIDPACAVAPFDVSESLVRSIGLQNLPGVASETMPITTSLIHDLSVFAAAVSASHDGSGPVSDDHNFVDVDFNGVEIFHQAVSAPSTVESLGDVWRWFTGGAGAASGSHPVLAFQLAPSLIDDLRNDPRLGACCTATTSATTSATGAAPAPTATPEPGTMTLVATGLIGVFGFARRRKNSGTG